MRNLCEHGNFTDEYACDSCPVTLWAIDKDSLDSGHAVGIGQTLAEGDGTRESFNAVVGRTVYVSRELKVSDIRPDRRVRFRLYDDDGELYYSGACDVRALDITDDAFNGDYADGIERWGAAYAGAIHAVFRRSDIAKHAPEFAERHPSAKRLTGDENWLPIYG